MDKPLSEAIVLTCVCGSVMAPTMGSEEELLYVCSNEYCFAQVNVMTVARAEILGLTPKKDTPRG